MTKSNTEIDLEYFEIKVTADKRKADELYSIMSNLGTQEVPMPPIPITAMKDFIDGKRPNLFEVTVNDEVYLTFEASNDSASALVKMVKSAGVEEFPVAPLPIKHLRAFVQGQRENVSLLEIRRNKNVQVRVKPEKKEDV